ncbi:hypothetical protein I7101_004161 [Vibrio cholerae]|nr:hypothetical protein [Vibrio cholerae]
MLCLSLVVMRCQPLRRALCVKSKFKYLEGVNEKSRINSRTATTTVRRSKRVSIL